MCGECQVLRDRIEELEALLVPEKDSFPPTWLLAPNEKVLLGLLLARNVVTHDAMWSVLYGHLPECDRPQRKFGTSDTVTVQLSKLRRNLAPRGVQIDNVWGVGHSMSAKCKAIVRAAIQEYTGQRAA